MGTVKPMVVSDAVKQVPWQSCWSSVIQGQMTGRVHPCDRMWHNDCISEAAVAPRPPPPPLHHRAAGTNLTQEQGKTTRRRQAGHPPPGCPLQGPASSEAPKGQGELGVKAAQPLQENKTRPIPCHSPCPQERMQAVASQSCNCLEILRTAKARHPLWGSGAPVPTAGGLARQPAERPPDGGSAEPKHHQSHDWTIPSSQQPQRSVPEALGGRLCSWGGAFRSPLHTEPIRLHQKRTETR